MADQYKKVIVIDADLSGFLKSINTAEQATQRMQTTLGQQGQKVSQILGTSFSSFQKVSKFDETTGSLQSLGQEIGKTSTQVQLANGVVGTYTESAKKMTDGTVQVTGSFKQANTATESYSQALNRLFKRAILTIPVWYALRTAIMAIGKTLKDGITNIISFDKALQKAKRNLQGSASDIESNFKRLRQEVTQLSLASGVSVEKITNAFQKFATVGFDFETSLAGANVATKLAVTLFGDAEQNANALARAFRVLVKNSKDSRSASQQLQEVGALLNDLWKDQAFEINEIAGALERFAPVASSAGLSMKETIQVLSALQTAGIRGTRAGRLFSTAILQLDKNFGKIANTLGLEINPQLTSTLDRFLAVTKAIGVLNKTDRLKASQAVQELFGGVRGGQVPQALIAVGDILDNVLKRTGDVEQFNKDFEDVSTTVGILADRFHNANREIGKALVTGIIGGDDFKESLKDIVNFLQSAIPVAKGLGVVLNALFRNSLTALDLVLGRETLVSEWIKDIGKGLQAGINASDLAGATMAEKILTSFNKALQGGSTKRELQDLFAQLTTFDAGSLNIDTAVYDTMISKTQELLDSWIDVVDEQEQSNQELSKIDKDGIYEKIVASKLKELQVQGRLNSEIVKAEINLRKRFDIQGKFEDQLERQLELERSINDEKRLQSRLGSDSIRLFEIAQQQGTDIAKKIGDVLAGNIDFSSFVRRGGQALEVFKDQFADIFKQQQALAFFQGNRVPGLENLKGGFGINIQEGQALRTPVSAIDTILRGRQAEQALIQRRETQPAQANIDVNNEFNISIDPSNIAEFSDKTVDEISKQLPQVGSKVNQALTKAIYNKQTNTL